MAKPEIGEVVEVEGLDGRFEVIANDDPSLVTLRAAAGATLKAGILKVRRIEEKPEGGTSGQDSEQDSRGTGYGEV